LHEWWSWKRDYINKGVEVIGINQTNIRVSFKACKEKLGALKRIRLEVLLH
jgi:hypothetical protein